MVNDISLFLYGFDITLFNQYVNFKASMGGPELTAVIPIGNYTATQFMTALKTAMETEDVSNTYTIGLDRTVSAGRSNRMRISTSGSFLELLFLTGSNAGSTPRSIMGFADVDYVGATSYAGITNAGTILIPEMPVYNYQPPASMVENDGVKNVSASGIKETLVFSEMQFFSGEWKWITDLDGEDQFTQWSTFLRYAIKQLQFEYQPSINEDPTEFIQCTLETTDADSNGLKFKLAQMTSSSLYRFYQTGMMKFRVVIQ